MEVTARKRGMKWEYRFEIASIGGKRKQKSKGGFRTKAEAMKAGNEALAMYNATGQFRPVESGMSYSDFLDLWMEEYVKLNLSVHTMSNYDSIINLYVKPAVGDYRLSTLNHTVLQEVINSNACHLSAASLHSIRTVLRSSLNYAMTQKKLIPSNPATNLSIPKECVDPETDVRAYSLEEVSEYLHQLEGHNAWYVIMIALYTGMRLGEIYALTWDCVNFDDRIITVNKNIVKGHKVSTPKTQKSSRKIPFGNTLYNLLRDMRRQQLEAELRLGEYYHYNYLQKNKVLMSCSKNMTPPDGAKRIDFVIRHDHGAFRVKEAIYNDLNRYAPTLRMHNIRHTHATTLIESGVSVKAVAERLGHTDVRITINRYVDNTVKMQEEAVHAFEEAWTNRGQKKVK